MAKMKTVVLNDDDDDDGEEKKILDHCVDDYQSDRINF